MLQPTPTRRQTDGERFFVLRPQAAMNFAAIAHPAVSQNTFVPRFAVQKNEMK